MLKMYKQPLYYAQEIKYATRCMPIGVLWMLFFSTNNNLQWSRQRFAD